MSWQKQIDEGVIGMIPMQFRDAMALMNTGLLRLTVQARKCIGPNSVCCLLVHGWSEQWPPILKGILRAYLPFPLRTLVWSVPCT